MDDTYTAKGCLKGEYHLCVWPDPLEECTFYDESCEPNRNSVLLYAQDCRETWIDGTLYLSLPHVKEPPGFLK